MEQKDRLEKMSEIIRRTWKDEKFKKALIADVKGVLKSEYDIELPEKVNVTVIEETADNFTIVLPARPELSDEVLEGVAGGSLCMVSGSAVHLCF
jgi:hypothetical protein